MKVLKNEDDKVEMKRKPYSSQNIQNLKRKHNSNKFLNDLKKIGYFSNS